MRKGLMNLPFGPLQVLSPATVAEPEFLQKLNYIHNNPTQPHWRLCQYPEEYKYSSAKFYEKGVDEFTFLSHYIIVLPPSQKLSTRDGTCDVPFTLHPGPWFKSYLWQDGSTDSVYSVTQPGLYYVTITDACGSIIKDSLNFVPTTAIPLDIGPDRTKCNSDTLHLSANAGFISYTWSNNYNISSLTAQNVVVNPLVDTSYYIKAAIGPGCFAYDTVHIKVNKSPAVNIGADTSFCFGDSTIINAGSGFSSYLWSNGASAQTITVKAAGIYSIIVTTAQGCQSYDTMHVLRVYPLPAVQLNKLSGLCVGETRTLDAGVFASYAWQDGSKARTFEVKNTGNYFVTVSDANGCRGSDTASITKILPLPQGFFRSDTSICINENIELKPVSLYNSYLWSTGGTTRSVIITQPGLYWLAVKDNNNCKGTDSITVNPKECPIGFYVPTAFTPNNDGKNDVFRPILFGNLKQYQFAIYNRFGQAVFQSSELGKGWNGNIAGVPQQTAAFAWSCSYQFEGGEVKVEKGTVVLIR
ncbi:MAG: gliding motility-associated C-terminal protein [Segetibacter sp.]|nr:gliding motility-associated C-terminal protein [Segetibacter sp.]